MQKTLSKSVPDQQIKIALRAAFQKARSMGARPQDADDVAQDSVIKALEDVSAGKIDIKDLVPWTIGIASKRTPTNQRGEGRRRTRQEKHEYGRSNDFCNADDPERILGWNWVMQVITDLPERQRQVVGLMVLGYTTNEIAAKLEIKAGTVRSHLSTAHEALQKLANQF